MMKVYEPSNQERKGGILGPTQVRLILIGRCEAYPDSINHINNKETEQVIFVFKDSGIWLSSQ